MRRLLLTVLVCISFTVSAQEPGGLIVQNRTNHTLYVLVPGGQEILPQSRYRQIPPGGLLPVESGGALNGVAYQRGSFLLSTFSFTDQEIAERTRRSATRVYLPVEERHLSEQEGLEASSFDSLLSEPQIDDVYLEWVGTVPGIARARERGPMAFYVDLGEGRQTLSVSESLLWQRGGTDLEWLKGTSGATDLYLAAASYSAFSEESSLFIYLFEEVGRRPLGTLELSPGRGNGFVFLWQPTELRPSVVGNLVSSDFFMEAQLWRSELESLIGADLLSLTAEVSTANSSAGVWEEFLVARVQLANLFRE